MKISNKFILRLIQRYRANSRSKHQQTHSSPEPVLLQRPLGTSTPPNFRILPMNQLDSQRVTWNEDFKIYDEFYNQETECQERIYQNLLEMVGQEEIPEDVLCSRGNTRSQDSEYEVVQVQRRKLRSLKALRT